MTIITFFCLFWGEIINTSRNKTSPKMKKAVYISFIINLFVCISLHSKDRTSKHLYALQHLINANLAYDSG